GIRDDLVTGVQTCALPIYAGAEAVGVAGLLVVPPHPTDAARLMTNAARIIPLIGFSFVGVTLPNREEQLRCRRGSTVLPRYYCCHPTHDRHADPSEPRRAGRVDVVRTAVVDRTKAAAAPDGRAASPSSRAQSHHRGACGRY